MAGKILEVIINLVASVTQLFVAIPNALINQFIPDLGENIMRVTETLTSIFEPVTWAISLLPEFIIFVLVFIITIEIGKVTIGKTLHLLTSALKLIQNIKFW